MPQQEMKSKPYLQKEPLKSPKTSFLTARRAIKEVRKVGNSLGIILPKLLSQDLVQSGTLVHIVRLGRFLIISPAQNAVSFEEQEVHKALQGLFPRA